MTTVPEPPSTVAIPAPGTTLGGTLFRAKSPRAAVVLHPATGIPAGYYRHFARWLADARDLTCLTYDYRGFGASASGPIRHATTEMADWGITDQQAARDWLAAQMPDLPLWVIGHSLGGFMLGYQRDLQSIARVIAVASGPVHVRDHPWPYQASARLFWYGLGPALVATTGYLPARASGLGADLPGPVFRQWKRWCTSDGFHRTDTTLPAWTGDALIAPLRSVAIDDDVMIPASVVARISALYPCAPHTHATLSPGAFGLGKVGHLSAFARRNASLWPSLLGE